MSRIVPSANQPRNSPKSASNHCWGVPITPSSATSYESYRFIEDSPRQSPQTNLRLHPGDAQEMRDEITPKWMARVRREARPKCSLTIPCGEHSSMRLMIDLQGRRIGESA